MRDDLRAGGYLPLTEPYTAIGGARFTHVGGGGETTTSGVLTANVGTPNAIVDWVFVELRDAQDSTVVLATRSALVQRDGDIVNAVDGLSALTFNGFVGKSYFLSVKHRNHLGVMTASAVTLTSTGTLVDFTTASDADVYNRPGAINYNGAEMVNLGGVKALWAGNANADGKVKYQGSSSDVSVVLANVLTAPGNTTIAFNYNNAFGYFAGDINLDGKVKYQGSGNDPIFIFTNVLSNYLSLNTAGLYNYDLFVEQLPLAP